MKAAGVLHCRLPRVLCVVAALWSADYARTAGADDVQIDLRAQVEHVRAYYATLRQDVLRARDGLLRNYDSLLHTLAEIESDTQDLRTELAAQSDLMLRGAAKEFIARLAADNAALVRMVEDFLSANAVHLNSLIFLPTVARAFEHARDESGDDIRRVDAVLDELYAAVLSQLSASDAEARDRAQALYAELVAFNFSALSPQLEKAARDVRLHVGKLLETGSERDRLVAAIFDLEPERNLVEIAAAVQKADLRQHAEAVQLRRFLLAFALVAGLLLVWGAISLRRSYVENRELADYPRLSPNPVLRVGAGGTILHANPATKNYADAPSALLPGNLPALFDQAAGAPSAQATHQYHAAGRDWLLTLQQSGDRRSANLYLQDVSELLRSERTISAVLKTVHDCLIVIDEFGTVESANPATERVFGYAPAELVGTNISRLMREREAANHDGYLARYRETGIAHIIGRPLRELPAVRRDGTPIEVDLTVTEISTGSGRRFVGLVRDITERKRVETAIRALAGINADDEKAYIESCARTLAEAFSTRYSMIASYADPSRKRMRARAIWTGSGFAQPVEYELEGTPCAEAFVLGTIVVEDRVVDRYPADWLAAQLAVRGYMGTALLSARGEPVGIVVVASDAPIGERPWMRPLLELFARRIASELERWREERRVLAQMRVLGRIAAGDDLVRVLDELCRDIEQQINGAVASVMRFEHREGVLNLLAGPSLPPEFAGRLIGLPVADGHTPCSTAAARAEAVLVSSEGDDPLWGALRDDALAFGICACWSMPIFDDDGTVLGTFALSFRDAIEPHARDELAFQSSAAIAGLAIQRARDTEALRAEKESAQITLASISDAIITTDGHGTIEFMNPVAESLTGYSLDEARGTALSEVYRVTGRDGSIKGDGFINEVLAGISGPRTPAFRTLVNRDGVGTDIQESIAPLRDRDGGITGVMLIVSDVTAQMRLQSELEWQATHDALTGLVNRSEFERRLRAALGENTVVDRRHSLLYLDLDQFKVVNDTCGHAAGDALLAQLADELRTVVNEGDTLGRLGGDEFALLALNCDVDAALRLGDRLRSTIRGHRFIWQGRSFAVGASVGVVPLDGYGPEIGAVLSDADIACYTAKERGRNRVHLYRPGDSELARRRDEMRWVPQLRDALSHDRFALHCQRIEPIGNGERHCELLLRLDAADDGAIGPDAFIPAAERFGLMPEIDRWVIRTAFRTIAATPSDVFTVYAINLCGASLNEADLVGLVRGELERHKIVPSSICFEVTETAAIHNLATAARVMRQIKALGCRFALDDFGSGLSSYTYLKQLPIDYLKIDGSFVRDVLSDPLDRAIVESVVQIARVLGIQTVAEWVESPAILAELERIGVDYAQGYAIERPHPIELAVES